MRIHGAPSAVKKNNFCSPGGRTGKQTRQPGELECLANDRDTVSKCRMKILKEFVMKM